MTLDKNVSLPNTPSRSPHRAHRASLGRALTTPLIRQGIKILGRGYGENPFLKKVFPRLLLAFLRLSPSPAFFLCMNRPKKKAKKKERPHCQAPPDTCELLKKLDQNLVPFTVSSAPRELGASTDCPAKSTLIYKSFRKGVRGITLYQRVSPAIIPAVSPSSLRLPPLIFF